MEGAALPDRAQPDTEPDAPGYGLDLRNGVPAVDRHRDRGLDLTPEERVARRKNRQILVALAVSTIVVLGLALIATAVYWGNEPSGPRIAVPAGYKAVSDGYFAYAVPKAWNTNPAFTDDAGDLDTSGPTGWAGEHRAYRFTPPVIGETPPTSLQAFGMSRPSAFALTGGHPLAVPGAATSLAYTATRPGGFRATVIDTWNSRTGVEMWLMVQAPAGVTNQIVSSLRS